ncbi:hypothetical protein K503DRAFT_781355 [Rhizopogon vinicolor AM-OR11-026]|uniref:DUF6533 domain-containing protein n=1 Tax=Rhizopogon vinicolor AM-OR11-026 TaxID=1314800 RepID=A0A1B7N6P4_9AGAM|nr:hypothetical protein K503DRAFT_781355 [Rhizopogon vinicolor AM-OR11-026]
MPQFSVIESEGSEKYVRVGSISIAVYEYIFTLSAEWQFYRSQSSIFHPSLACVLFILIRYLSVAAMVISNYGFFSIGFTSETCQGYYLLAPSFKVIQIMVSQVILGVRTFNIAKRDRRLGIFLLMLYIVSISLEWFTNMSDRSPVVVNVTESKLYPYYQAVQILMKYSCTSGNTGKTLSAWFNYLAVMVYDLVMLTISTSYLLKYSPLSTRLERLIRIVIYDGIGYFIILTGKYGTNVFYFIFYHASNPATQCARLAPISLQEMADPEIQRLENVVLARSSRNTNTVSAHRSPFNSKSPIDTGFSPTTLRNVHPNDVDRDIRVRVERTVVVQYANDSERSSSCEKPAVE